MKPTRLLSLMLVPLSLTQVRADGEIGFLERFALAEDRAEALKELIPGTEDFFYYSALHAQNEGRLAEVEALLESWQQSHGETERLLEIRNRQALLTYGDDPGKTLAYLKKELALSFDHQQERLDAKPDFPTRLDPALVSREAFLNKALARADLGGVSDAGLDALLRQQADLKPAQRRQLLSRLRHPDHEPLVGLIAADLRSRESKGFGEFEIHRRLTLAQLDELAGLQPELAQDPRFVETRLLRLQPGGDELVHRNPEAERAHLDRVWDYVRTLPPAFASMKAAVLHRRLDLARKRGEHPEEEFLEYLRLPRPLPYVRADYLREQQQRGIAAVDLSADHSATLGLPPIGTDEALVREYLEHFFVEADGTARFSPYLDETWLEHVFAETKLLNGLGDARQWFSRLGPAQVQALKDRVEIAFAPTNPEHLAAADEVVLTATLKNVPELIVKVYEINALNYYRERGEEINTDLDLDGLVANEETVHRYGEAPIRRRVETFRFDSLKGKRGVWVIELIGNGISSRALVRKGELQPLTRTTVGGELVAVVDEANQPVPKAAAWFGGRRYEADEKGLILLPFSEAGTVSVVLTDGDFASLAKIALPQESYAFDAGFLLEQETLLPGAESTVAVRPVLSLNGEPVSLSRLEKTKLIVTTTDLDGIESISEATDFALADGRESLHTFRVPARLRSVRIDLTGKIESVTKAGERTDVSASRLFGVNGAELQELTADAHLSRLGERYVVQVLGRSGEAMADRAVSLSLHHREFAEPIEATLKSDADGRIDLGPLPGIAAVSCHSGGLPPRHWTFARDRVSRSATLHAKAGETVEIPLPHGSASGRAALAVFELRAGTVAEDAFSAAKFEPGLVRLEGLKPGNYEVFLKEEDRSIALKVTAPETEQFGHALSRDRHLRLPGSKPLRIASAEAKDGKLLVSLGNADAATRLHLVATRFLPEFDPYASLAHAAPPTLFEILRGAKLSRYVSGRDIGEEYRYILERRGAKKFPGNLLARPGLLLNPWELSETQTGVKEASQGEAYRKSEGSLAAQRAAGGGMAPPSAPAAFAPVAADQTPSLNFLARQAVVLTNLQPGEDGTLSLDLAELGDRQHVHLVAVNATDTVSRTLALPEPEGGAAIRDLRLDSTLDPSKRFTQRRKATLLRPGQTLTVSDFRSSEVQPYGTIGDVYKTLLGISGDEGLAEFAFVANWASLDETEKRAIYSEQACHELHFFLSRKDPEFFKAVVKPYLANKKDKTFLDRYLLEEPLERYLAPWEFGRLNIVERILLARRIGEDERANTATYVIHLHQLLPPDPERDAFLYRRALRGRGADVLGFADAGQVSSDAFAAPVFASGSGAMRESPGLHRRGVAAKPTTAAAPMAEAAPMPAAPPAPMPALGLAVADEALLERAREQALYQTLDKTKELAENNYRHLPIATQNADLVTVNRFWRDFANWNGEGGFYSREFPAATSNFTEAMFALSVLDLPFASEEHRTEVTDNVFKLTAASPVVVFHEEIEEAPPAEGATPILVSQNFLRADDRHREEDGQMVDKFVTGEFLSGVVYASQVVVTNPTSSAHRLDLLVQIPEGAVPVAGGDYTKSHPLNLAAFSTERIETMFYFPASSDDGTFALYPVQVAKGEQSIAAGEARSLKVVDTLSDLDEASWDYLSQYGTEKQVLDYFAANNLHRLDLHRIAWRARESVDFLRQATALIGSRHGYDAILWSYGLHHNDAGIAREYLKHRDDFLSRCGKAIECELVSLDPVERHWHQHLDYAPLVNARAHRLGRDHRILNDRFRAQYGEFLDLLAHRPELGAEDRLAVAAYLSLQDRIGEALAWLDSVPEAEVVPRVQYDYLRAYHAFHREDPAAAKAIADAYAEYPVEKWRKSFAEVAKQVSAIAGENADPDQETREGQIERLSAKEPFLELSATGRELSLRHRNLKSVTVNYYEMDLEFLFSSRPFVSAGSGGFAFIRPNLVETKELPADGTNLAFSVPQAFASKNVLVEVVGGGRTSSAAVYSNRLDLRLTEGYGRLELRHEENGKPVGRAYVKVYAKMKDGSTRFFKDGYTDLRGQFDYASLSTDELDRVERLSLLVMSEEQGSLVREAGPPQR